MDPFLEDSSKFIEDTSKLTLAQRKKYVEELEKEPRLKLSDIYTFDTENLSKDEKDLLILESEVFFEEQKRQNHKYYIENKDYFIRKKKEFNEKYPEKVREYQRNYVKTRDDYYKDKNVCNVCGGDYVLARLKKHLGTLKHIKALKNLKVKEPAQFIG
jgi:excinuclease UvrABC ATPase subunit